ncbi:hypothetical protein [Treponema pectinovorum]|uniref:hypothetical protein n=1 Tax=Treponema pectinovorum TaxID=164 RepID=UPI0011F0EFC3|nr:hypothetical protein [Treponema pectinovorum]
MGKTIENLTGKHSRMKKIFEQKAFGIADFLFPYLTKEFDEKYLLKDDFPQYSSSEKKTVINKAFELLEKESVGRISQHKNRKDMISLSNGKHLLLKDLEAFVKGHDAVNYGKDFLSFVRPNAKQMQKGIENGWGWNAVITGYTEASSSSINGAINIEKIGDMGVFEDDLAAAKQYGIDHKCRILEEKKDIWIGDKNNEYYSYPDTHENRLALKDYIQEKPLTFSWEGFTEEQFNELRDEINSGNCNPDSKGRINIGSISVEFVIQDPETSWIDYNNYILGEPGKGNHFGVPYAYSKGDQLAINVVTENTYERFKNVVENQILEDFSDSELLKEAAKRPLVDWNNEEKVKEFYRTKLVNFGLNNSLSKDEYHKEPVEIIKEIAEKQEIEEVPDLFTREFKNRMINCSVSKDPFIVTKSILNEWKSSKTDCVPVLNEWLKKQGCTSKEGFEKFFKKLNSSEQNKVQSREYGSVHER